MLFTLYRRRKTVLIAAFLCLSFAITGASLSLSYLAQTRATAAQKRASRAVLCRMAEEADAIRILLSADETDESLQTHCLILCTAAQLLSGEHSTAAAVARDSAAFYRACASVCPEADAQTRTVYRQSAERISTLLSHAALSLTEYPRTAVTPTPLADAAAELAALSHSFCFVPNRFPSEDNTQNDPPAARYHGEGIVTREEAAALLRALPDNPARFFKKVRIDTEDVYLFTCANGYARVSCHGGHLLSYEIAPRDSHSDAPCVMRKLSDGDLETCADTFLAAAHIRATTAGQPFSDRGDVRRFTVSCAEYGTVMTLGVRMCDGTVLSFSIK